MGYFGLLKVGNLGWGQTLRRLNRPVTSFPSPVEIGLVRLRISNPSRLRIPDHISARIVDLVVMTTVPAVESAKCKIDPVRHWFIPFYQ